MLNFNFLVPLVVCIPLLVSIILVMVRHKMLSYLILVGTTFIIFLISLFLLVNFQFVPIVYQFGNFVAPFGIEYKFDTLAALFVVVVTFVAFIVSLWSKRIVLEETNRNNYYLFNSIFLLCITGSLGIILTNDAFNLFVFLEISSLATYILIALGGKRESPLSAFNYLIIGTIAASLYVFGVGIMYMIFGTLSIDALVNLIPSYRANPLFILGCLMMLVGILIKVALFPLFFWLPQAYQNSPAAISAFLGGTATKVALYMFLRIFMIMVGAGELSFGTLGVTDGSLGPDGFDLGVFGSDGFRPWLYLIAMLAIISMFVGGVLSIKNTDLKLLLAFSSISQVGFIMLGIIIPTPAATLGALFMIITHSLIKTGLFMCAGHLLLAFGSNNLQVLNGLGKKIPFTFICIIFLALSLAGIPGTSGFWGKLYLVLAALNMQIPSIETLNLGVGATVGTVVSSDYMDMADMGVSFGGGNLLGLGIAILILVGSILSFFYAWKIIASLWGEPSSTANTKRVAVRIPLYMNVALGIIVLCNILITFYPAPLVMFLNKVVYFTFVRV